MKYAPYIWGATLYLLVFLMVLILKPLIEALTIVLAMGLGGMICIMVQVMKR